MTPQEIQSLPYRLNVGIMLTNASGEVFVGQRIDGIGEAWQMPQGGIDKGEAPREAALRELTEETGIEPRHVRIEAESADWHAYDLPHDLVPTIWGGRYRGQKQKWFLMRLTAGDDVINIATEPAEFSSWRWLPVQDLEAHIVPFKREVYRAVISEFKEKL